MATVPNSKHPLVQPDYSFWIAESGTVKHFVLKVRPPLKQSHRVSYIKGGQVQRCYYQYNRGIWTEGFSINNLPY